MLCVKIHAHTCTHAPHRLKQKQKPAHVKTCLGAKKKKKREKEKKRGDFSSINPISAAVSC